MQWKMIYLARRNPALAAAAFPQAWREHSARGRQCRNVQDKVLGVAQCSRLLDLALPGATVDYDGVNVLPLRDLQAANDIWSDPETLAIMRPDEPRVFSTYVRNFTLVCSEHVLVDGRQADCAVFAFVRRRGALARSAFDAAWTHSPAAGDTHAGGSSAAVRVVHDLVVQPPPRGYGYDGIAEWWFASRNALEEAFQRGFDSDIAAIDADLVDRRKSVLIATQVTHRRP